MFAFGGASTFPTVQADMANKGKFKWAAVASCIGLLAIYSSVMIFSYRDVISGPFERSRTKESIKRLFSQVLQSTQPAVLAVSKPEVHKEILWACSNIVGELDSPALTYG